MDYKCVSCGKVLKVPNEGSGNIVCENCRFEYEYADNYLRYECDHLLFKNHKKKYLLYKVLSNNAYLSYIFLKEASLSLPEREVVKNFKGFILSHINSGKILDIGCGTLDLPGYLDFKNKSQFEFFGIDPISEGSFKGVRVVGCAEYLPFQDNFFQAVVFGTSLDHVCLLEQTIAEAYRVLNKGGKVLVWMSDRSLSLKKKLKAKIKSIRQYRQDGYRKDKYFVYDNFTVLHVPEGAVDPFHSYNESPRKTIALMRKADFRYDEMIYKHENEIFLCFTKCKHS